MKAKVAVVVIAAIWFTVVLMVGCAHLPKGTVGVGITYSTPVGGK